MDKINETMGCKAQDIRQWEAVNLERQETNRGRPMIAIANCLVGFFRFKTNREAQTEPSRQLDLKRQY